MISVHYLLQFLIFICIIPAHTIAETKLQIAFANGLNVMRCSDKQVQVYTNVLFVHTILECNNKVDIFDYKYASFSWTELKIVCSSTDDEDEVHEEIVIEKTPGANGIRQLPDVQGQLCPSDERYDFEIKNDINVNFDKILSQKQPATDTYFNENNGLKERRIYISFKEHPVICRVIFTNNDDNPCPSMDNQLAADVDYACYYNPSVDQLPTIGEMEAELKQVEEATKPDGATDYVLDLEKPKVIPSDPCNSEEHQPDKPNHPQSHKPSKGPSHKKTVNPHKPPKSKEKPSIPKIIGIIFGILLLIVLIGGIGFYLIQKHRSNNSSSNIENGDNKALSSRLANQSQQSLATKTATDINTELSMNIPSKQEKPTIELQKGNKKQRTGTSMVFNEDM